MARYQRYLNKELIYPKCFDTNGIPTQKSFSSISKDEPTVDNIIKFAIERSKFYEETFNSSGIHFGNQTYHTYDERSIKIAYSAFEFLKSKGIAYKATTEYLLLLLFLKLFFHSQQIQLQYIHLLWYLKYLQND